MKEYDLESDDLDVYCYGSYGLHFWDNRKYKSLQDAIDNDGLHSEGSTDCFSYTNRADALDIVHFVLKALGEDYSNYNIAFG